MNDISVTPVKASDTTIDTLKLRPDKPKLTAADWVRDMRMSADVNNTTVGVNTERITPDLMLATSKKLLGISRREVEPDPKDSLLFQRFYGPAEYFAEHILRDAGKLGRNLLWKATNKGNLDHMTSGALEAHISDVFYDSKLANMIDGSSPLETVDAAYKTTRIGEGGVADVSSAPDEMRTVQPSYFGYLDPVRSPERLRVGLDMYMSKHCMKGSDGKLYQKFINAHTGKEELVDSVTAARSVVASGEMMDAKTKSIFALGGPTGVRIVPRNKVDYFLPRADEAYSMASNMVTMPSSVKEMRLLMGCLHPMTSVISIDKKNMLDVIPAKGFDGLQKRTVGCTQEGKALCYDVRNTIAKFPSKKKWFKKVVLRSGRALITSYDHKWPVLEDGKVKLVRADALKAGAKVLRSSFKDLPNRRTFIEQQLVTKAVACLLGCAVRSFTLPNEGKARIVYQLSQKPLLEAAIQKLQLKCTYFYANAGDLCLGIHDAWFIKWLVDNIGAEPATRKVPSVILSACADVAAYFIDAYTADKTQVGIDSNEDIWILNIPNMLCRDGLALVLARLVSDTLYRDAVRSTGTTYALKLVSSETHRMFGDMFIDTVKSVQETDKATLMIDIDINDNMYVCGNGIVTHNSKYPLQAVSLDHREAPLVRGLDEATGKDMHSIIGRYLGARFAKQGGTVTAVRRDRIDVIYDDGTKGSIQLYHNFPMNAKGFIQNTPTVKAGQSFKAGDCLAASNYTDDKGVAAISTNLRTGWLSWKGGTYEDGMVISESAAKKLTSTTMYKTAVDLDKTIKLGKQNYITWKPSEYTKEQMEGLDDNGIVKPGTVLRKGDPMILAVQTTEPSPGTMGKRVLTDVSEVWEHAHPGIVTDVVKTRNGVRVFATVTAPTEIGDKLSGLHGNKGVVSQIIPDEQMPVAEDGKPLDVLFSPLGLISRTNSAMIHEALLGKVAAKTGVPEVVPAFYKGDLYQYVNDKLKQNHLKDSEDLTDPETGRKIPHVLTGVTQIFKLKHIADTKMSARGTDEYTQEELPGGSGATGCYPGVQRIMTIHGMKRISEICERRQPEYVLTWDGDQYCYKQVTDWFVRKAAVSDILNIKTKYNISTTGNDHHSLRHSTSIYPTKNHHMFLADMTVVEAGMLRVGDKLAGIGPLMTEDQKAVILGTLLGDGCQCRGETVSCEHSIKQLNYMTWKYELLKGLGARLFSGEYSTTESRRKDGTKIKASRAKVLHIPKSAALSDLFELIYIGTRERHITREALEHLGELGFCVWFLDDGSMWNRSHVKGVACPESSLATQGFSAEDALVAVEWLKDFLGEPDGVHTSEYYTKDGSKRYIIRFLRNASWKIANIIARNVPHTAIPASKRWLRGYAETCQETQLVYQHDCTSRLGVVPVEITDIQAYQPDKEVQEVCVYDFTVSDTHKYILSGGVICSNSKRFGTLEQSAMVGHNAFQNILDSKLLRGQSNADFWRSIRTGGIPTIPGEPLVHKKFFAHLTGSGINVRKTKQGISCFALSNSDVKELAGPRELKTRDTYEAKTFRPLDGGLFGQDVFGPNGDKWGYIQLDEPLPNPVMEEPLARLLRIPLKDFSAVVAGKQEVNGMKSAADIKEKLSHINLEAESAQALKEFKEATTSKKDNALKRYVAIERMRRNELPPEEYMLDRIPVIPPIYRPVSSHNGLTMVADSNYLYAQLLDARDDFREAKNLPEEYQKEERETIYRQWKELAGLYDPENPKLKNKHVQGLLKWALGESPKWSAFQRKVLGATVDTVGRGVVAANPRLKLNQIGIPKDMAFGIMSPFIARELVRAGYTPVEALKQVKNQAPQAFEKLKEVMKTHPVEMNRAPSLHKLNIMAFEPVLTTGHAIHVNPSIVVPFCMDFDGDQANIHVPVSDGARAEARRRMFPERNLIAMKNRKILYKPEKEYMQGLYIATRMKQGPNVRTRTFRTLEEARAAQRQGLIDVDDPIVIQEN
jgi:hypothetical protein